MIERITQIIEWYASLKRDFHDVPQLMSARRTLVTSLAEMAVQVAILYEQRNGAEFQRKNAHSEILRREMSVEKTSAAAAKIIADNEVSAAMQREYDADSEYQKGRILYDAWKNVCDVMGQHISNLKAERTDDFRGSGSQQT